MALAEHLQSDLIFPQQNIKNRKHLLRFACQQITLKYHQLDAEQLIIELMKREKLGNTGIGEGIAIPHCRLPKIDTIDEELIIVFISSQSAFDYNAFDQKPVNLIFVLFALGNNQRLHIELLSSIAKMASSEKVRQQLTASRTAASVLNILSNNNHHG